MPEPLRKETPSLTKNILDLINQQLVETFTAMPGKIVEYDYETNLAVVQPSLKRKFKALEDATLLPLVSSVPVCFPSSKDAYFRLPIAVGDEGELIFQMRSIDAWLENGGEVNPDDPRKFHLSDATFWPGLRSKANPLKSKGKKNSVVIKNAKGWIEIMTSGKFKITNGSEELMRELVRLVEALIQARSLTMLGAQPLVNYVSKEGFPDLKALLEKLKGEE